MRRSRKPLLGITLGDPSGVGPEVAYLAAIAPEVRRVCRPLLIGDEQIVRRTQEALNHPGPVEAIDEVEELSGVSAKDVAVLHYPVRNPAGLPYGKLSARAGRAAYDWVVAGALLAIQKEIDGLVTAPLNKEAVLRAGIRGFQGHTELLAQLSKTKRFAMMLAGGTLRVVLVTTHAAIENVASLLTPVKVLEKIVLTNAYLNQIGIKRPHIAVAALNPHAGEGGAFGNQEARIIRPAISRAKRRGIHVSGPYPADTLFARHLREPYDAVVVMYHDQGLIPLKLLAFGKGVNITLGLPFVRTSPDHGTAFELAGTGQADPGSMIEAVLQAARMAKEN